jgi:hypothetical protein
VAAEALGDMWIGGTGWSAARLRIVAMLKSREQVEAARLGGAFNGSARGAMCVVYLWVVTTIFLMDGLSPLSA